LAFAATYIWDFYMNIRLRWLTVLLLFLAWFLPSTDARAIPLGGPPLQEETPTEELSTPAQEEITCTPSVVYPVDVINAVNDLRILHGLNVLAVHPALMDVGAQQANALAASQGAVGHQRPCGMTLGQDLLSRGFALWGDLSQDGYRSENWITADSAEQAITSWLGDEMHANTMLSPHRSHIGAAVAVSDQTYIVLETAYQTPSGKMQWGADVYLTAIPSNQAACLGRSNQFAEAGDLSQYSIPVVLNTARPDGDVIHNVQYGQTLWSLAIQYGTTIDQIKRLNNLASDTIVPGWTLLIVKGATQPATATAIAAMFEPNRQSLQTPTMIFTPAQTELSLPVEQEQFVRQNSTVVVAFMISFSVLVAAIVGFGKKKE
jgi:LysM repeat protein